MQDHAFAYYLLLYVPKSVDFISIYGCKRSQIAAQFTSDAPLKLGGRSLIVRFQQVRAMHLSIFKNMSHFKRCNLNHCLDWKQCLYSFIHLFIELVS